MRPLKIFSFVLIGLTVMFLTVFSGTFLGRGLIFIVIALLPAMLARLFYGRNYLRYIKPAYAVSISLQLLLVLSIQFLPDFFSNLINDIYSMVFPASESIVRDMEKFPFFNPLFFSVVAYLYFYVVGDERFVRLYRRGVQFSRRVWQFLQKLQSDDW